MTNRQIVKTIGSYTFSSRFDSGNAFDFKQGKTENSFEVYPAADAQGFSYLHIF